jgi:sugar phosphate isomerase/epimerase
MKIGTSTRTVWHLNTLDAIDFVANTGFDHVELWTEYPNLCLDLIRNEEIQLIEKKIKSHKLGVFVHAPLRDINISSLNHGIRKESIRQLKDAIRFSRKINSPIIVMHPGRKTSSKEPFSSIEFIFFEALAEIVKEAEEEGVVVAIENMELRKEEYIISPENLKKVIEAINSPHFKATFDIAHANSYSRNIIYFFETIKEYVVHIHVSDNKGFAEETHMDIGQGEIDLSSILRHIKKSGYQGSFTLEGYNPDHPEKTVIDNYLRLKKIMASSPD